MLSFDKDRGGASKALSSAPELDPVAPTDDQGSSLLGGLDDIAGHLFGGGPSRPGGLKRSAVDRPLEDLVLPLHLPGKRIPFLPDLVYEPGAARPASGDIIPL